MLRETIVLGEDERSDARPGEGPQRFVLVVLSGAQIGQRLVLGKSKVTIGRGPEADIRLEDEGISRAHATLQRHGARYVITDEGSTNGLFVNGDQCTSKTLARGDKIGIGADTVLRLRLEDDLDAELEKQIFSAALYDGLTGAFNRAAFDREIELEVARSARHERDLSLLMFDLDHFKAINDTHGHPVGDAVLREFVDRLRVITRAEDYLARFGGEEFIMVCTGIDATAAKRLADRALSVISTEPFRSGDVSLNVTVSIGVADLATLAKPSVAALVEAADAALYRAKTSGRNRVGL